MNPVLHLRAYLTLNTTNQRFSAGVAINCLDNLKIINVNWMIIMIYNVLHLHSNTTTTQKVSICCIESG